MKNLRLLMAFQGVDIKSKTIRNTKSKNKKI